MNPLNLPPELILHVLHYCSAQDACNFELVSKACQPHSNDEKLWEAHVKNDLTNDILHKPDNLPCKAWYKQKVYENSDHYQYRMQARISIQNAAIRGNLVGRTVGFSAGYLIITASFIPLLVTLLLATKDEPLYQIQAMVEDWNKSEDSFLTFLYEQISVFQIAKTSSVIAVPIFLSILPLIQQGYINKTTAMGSFVCERLLERTTAIFVSFKPITLQTYDFAKKNVKKIIHSARATSVKTVMVAISLFCILSCLWQICRPIT